MPETTQQHSEENLTFEPLWSRDEVFEQIEPKRQESAKHNGINRRVALIVLSDTQEGLCAKVEHDPETFIEVCESLQSTIDDHKAEIEIFESAIARLLFALNEIVDTEENEND